MAGWGADWGCLRARRRWRRRLLRMSSGLMVWRSSAGSSGAGSAAGGRWAWIFSRTYCTAGSAGVISSRGSGAGEGALIGQFSTTVSSGLASAASFLCSIRVASEREMMLGSGRFSSSSKFSGSLWRVASASVITGKSASGADKSWISGSSAVLASVSAAFVFSICSACSTVASAVVSGSRALASSAAVSSSVGLKIGSSSWFSLTLRRRAFFFTPPASSSILRCNSSCTF